MFKEILRVIAIYWNALRTLPGPTFEKMLQYFVVLNYLQWLESYLNNLVVIRISTSLGYLLKFDA